MIFNEQVDLDLCINNVKISPASSCKFLGLAIAPYLSWKTHISNVIRKVYKGIFVLKQTSSSLFIMPSFNLIYVTVSWCREVRLAISHSFLFSSGSKKELSDCLIGLTTKKSHVGDSFRETEFV